MSSQQPHWLAVAKVYNSILMSDSGDWHMDYASKQHDEIVQLMFINDFTSSSISLNKVKVDLLPSQPKEDHPYTISDMTVEPKLSLVREKLSQLIDSVETYKKNSPFVNNVYSQGSPGTLLEEYKIKLEEWLKILTTGGNAFQHTRLRSTFPSHEWTAISRLTNVIDKLH